MQLSKRLQAVAKLVSKGNRVADVGCDHAYTSIYLAKNDISPHIIAMDVNQGPVDRAEENIVSYGCDTRIEVRKSDGLEKLEQGEADTIIIAGMGGALTVQILTQYPEILRSIRELILQPQSELHKVRQMLSDYGFIIISENMVKEEGKFYFIMKAIKAEIACDKDNTFNIVNKSNKDNVKHSLDSDCFKLTRPEHLYFGRILLEQNNPVLREYLLWDYGICEEILRSLNSARSESSFLRVREVKDRMDLIQSALKYYDKEI